MSQITFGTDGWRAIIAEDFTFANVERVAAAVARYVIEAYGMNGKTRPVLVGYDTRFLADKFAIRTAQTLISLGVPAKVSERDVPTPAIAYATQSELTAGALQITASHNPPEYCGMKYIPDYAGPATNEITEQILKHLRSEENLGDLSTIEVPRFDPRPAYMQTITERIDVERVAKAGLRVACECLYSTSRGYLDAALRDSGVQVHVLHDWRDPLFGGFMPEPKPEFLGELASTVLKEGLQVGLATDGDADRFGVIDDQGKYMSPNQLIALLTRHLVKNRGMSGCVVKTVATTHVLDRLCKMYGLEIEETPVGFKYIGELMRLRDVLIGGEESGGVSFKGHIPEKDGILANMLLVEMLAYENKPLSQIWADLAKEVGTEYAYRRRDLQLTMESQKRLIDHMLNKPFDTIGSAKVERVGRLDGLKFYVEDGSWVLFRPSGTEPLVRLYYEAASAGRVEQLKEDFNAKIEGVLSDLGARVLAIH
jgi:phosphomannomutase